MASLTWKRSDGGATEFAFSASAVLGRDPGIECPIVARGISRRHAAIEKRKEGFFLTDLGSTNGTLLNGSAIEGRVRLRPGDVIQLGVEILEFDAEPSELRTRSHHATEPLSRAVHLAQAVATKDSGMLHGMPEVLPRRLGKFYLLEKLGQGGMGEVYRARDLESTLEVAVKFIRSHIGRREAFLDFFHNREAVLAREIDHANVIRIYEHGVEKDRHFISMEYAHGASLYRYLKRRKPSAAVVLEILRQVACGLAAAHRQGVVHSDIKPANILLVENCPGSPLSDDDGVEEEKDQRSEQILEFDKEGDSDEKKGPRGAAYDEGLLEEIRRRIGPPPSLVLEDPPYFNRPAEMRFIQHYVDQMANGRGHFVLVEGESGTGKDRLISEFLIRQAEETERAAEAAGPTRPRFVELDCSRIEGIPLLYQQLNPGKPAPGPSLRQVVDALKHTLKERAEPTLLRVLDLGKASPAACHVLADGSSRMDQQPFLVLASLNPDDVRKNRSLKSLLDSVEPQLKELYLRPLTEYQVHRYLQDLFRDSLTGLDLSNDLYRLSGGNLARLLDLLQSFFDRSILRVDRVSGRVVYRPSVKEIELEEGKNLYEKYRSYGRMEQQVLETAAFMGERLFFDCLLRFLHVDETSLFFVVRQLLNDGFLAEEPRTWFRFTNAAFHRYMAERIPPPERPHMHRAISRLLQTVPVEESAELCQLRARHFTGCREYGKAVRAYLEGAHLARNSYQIDLAREMYQEILRIYRDLASREGPRKVVNAVLKDWFHRDGNWYEILGALGAEDVQAWVKIADFGISFRARDEERGYAVGKRPLLGTPRYLAPERGRGEHGGPLSDIFSLGIIAYEMVCGRPPFPGLKGASVIKAHRAREIKVPADVLERYPAGFENVLRGMLAVDPLRRWDAERVVRHIVKLQFDLEMRTRRSGG